MNLPRDLIRLWRKHGVSPHPLPTQWTQIRRETCAIDNVAFENARHRKLHLELASTSTLDIVHVVMYPRPTFDVPILALDMVSVNGSPSFAIADACPVTTDLTLPPDYAAGIFEQQRRYGLVPVRRDVLPEWGRAIFSDVCYMTRGSRECDPETFAAYVLSVTAFHMAYCDALDPSPEDHPRIRACHSRFCAWQLQNTRTRAVLATHFLGDPAAADAYMRDVMFDC
jgi:phycocyanobilin:ferredoxin oxidoreductase